MAKEALKNDANDTPADMKGLATIPANAVLTADFASGTEDFIKDWAETITVKVGDPKDGHLIQFTGIFIGPGSDIELEESESTIPTWLFTPLNKQGKPLSNVTVRLISPAILDGFCKEASARQQANPGKKVYFAAQWAGWGEAKKGRTAPNMYRAKIHVAD